MDRSQDLHYIHQLQVGLLLYDSRQPSILSLKVYLRSLRFLLDFLFRD